MRLDVMQVIKEEVRSVYRYSLHEGPNVDNCSHLEKRIYGNALNEDSTVQHLVNRLKYNLQISITVVFDKLLREAGIVIGM